MTSAVPTRSEEDFQKTPAEHRFGGSWRMFIPFALLPLLIVGSAVGVFLLFGKLADTQKSPLDYLQEIQSSSEHRRWQAAFELSRYLAQGDIGPGKPIFENKLLSLLKTSKPQETKLRQYILISLAQVGSQKSTPVLEEFAQDQNKGQSRIFAIWALGRLGSQQSAPLISKLTKSDDPGIRKTAAFSLGFVGSSKDISTLKKLLEDPIQDVRWNTALGLAQLGSKAGQHIIFDLMDLEKLRIATPNLRENERTEIALSAVNAVGRLKLTSAKDPLQKLSNQTGDPRLKSTINHVLEILAN